MLHRTIYYGVMPHIFKVKNIAAIHGKHIQGVRHFSYTCLTLIFSFGTRYVLYEKIRIDP